MDEILAFLQEQKPDIILLQEVYNSSDKNLERRFRSLEVIKEACGFPYVRFAPTFLDQRLQGIELNEGNAICSRFPIRTTEVIFYDVPYGAYASTPQEGYEFVPRNLQYAQVEVGERLVHVYNTQGIWGWDGDDSSRRLNMAQTIHNAIGNKTPTILAGDFNVRSDTRSIELLRSSMIDPLHGRVQTSFNMRIKSGGSFGSSVVDFMLVSPDISVRKAECLDVHISDHLPIVMTMDI